MAGLVLGTVGAVVGGYFGGPMGAQAGWLIGSGIGNAIDPQKTKTQGARLDDLKVQTNTYGVLIPWGWGTWQQAGNVIWSTQIQESSSTTKQGKGSGQVQETENFSYSVTLALGLCRGEIDGLLRLWANEILIYDTTAENTGAVGDIKYNMEIYTGTADQLPDPSIQSYQPDTPAYQDMAYIVFRDLPLEKFSNQIPSFKAEIRRSDNGAPPANAIQNLTFSQSVSFTSNITNAEIRKNPINGLIYVMRTANVLSSGVVFDIYDPITKSLVKSAQIPNIQISGLSNATKNFYFSYDGKIILPNLQNYVINGTLLNIPAIACVEPDYLRLIGISPYTDFNFINNPDRSKNYYVADSNTAYMLIRQNISGNNNKFNFIGIWINQPGGSTEYNTSSDTIFYSDGSTRDTWNTTAFDKANNRFYFVTVDATAMTRTVYLNSVNGLTFENKRMTLYTDPSIPFLVRDMYFDQKTKKLFVMYKLTTSTGGATYIMKIDTISNTIESQTPWLIDGASGQYIIDRFNVDESNRRFISASNSPQATDPLYFLNCSFDTMTFKQQSYTSLPFKPYFGYTSIAYAKETDSEWYLGAFDDTNKNTNIVINNGMRSSYGTYSLANIIKEILLETGLQESQFDTSELYDIEVRGYYQTGIYTARTMLEQLSTIYSFDAFESNGKLIFALKGKPAVATIYSTELGAKIYDGTSEFEILNKTRTSEIELPYKANIIYNDYNKAYERNTQEAKRFITTTQNVSSYEVPIVLDSDQAKQAVDKLMADTWTKRDQFTFATNYDYINVEIGDVVNVAKDDLIYSIKITKKDESQGIIKFEGVAEDATVYTQNGKGGTGIEDHQVIKIPSRTIIYPLDIPIFTLDDNDYGFYLVVNRGISGEWTGANIYQSTDGVQYTMIDTISSEAIVGGCNDILGAFDINKFGNVVDTGNTITVTLNRDDFTLSSISYDDLLNGKNIALVGNELIQFQNAELVGVNQYRLSGLLRGCWGTESWINFHDIGEQFFFFEFNLGKIKREDRNNTALNQTKSYAGVSFGTTLADAVKTEFTNTSVGLKPYAVNNVRGSYFANTSMAIRWDYRVRGAGLLRDSVDVQDDGDGSNFEIDVYVNSSTLLNTYSVNSRSFVYTNTAYQADLAKIGLTSTPISQNLRYVIYKVSDKVGRGYAYDTGINYTG